MEKIISSGKTNGTIICGKLMLFLLLISLFIGCQQTDTWNQKADMPTSKFGSVTCVVKGRIYTIGGAAGYDPLPVVEVFNPEMNTWLSRNDMPNHIHGLITINSPDGTNVNVSNKNNMKTEDRGCNI